eukprot:TRINITY_DN63370_c0_g1_i1.p1 TRINITY_DN63370_c0_g1~~TRINITY_DN63370_c0_g1_i1.p1  ORF type:complete len:551 (-),score=113.36 TRINITY_DN63370_c0_g1_i1:75-1727(-)
MESCPSPRATRTPRMVRSLKGGDGLKAIQACKERAAQDLYYRSEYLASIVSSAADVEAPAGEDLRSSLLGTQVPQLLSVTNELLNLRHKKACGWRDEGTLLQARSFGGTAPDPMVVSSPRSRPLPRSVWPQEVTETQWSSMQRTADSAREKREPFWQAEAARAGNKTVGCNEPPFIHAEVKDRQECTSSTLQGRADWQETYMGMKSMLESGSTVNKAKEVSQLSQSQRRMNAMHLKVKPVPGLHADALQENHRSSQEADQLRQLSDCNRVLSLSEDGIGDTATAELNFARFFCQLQLWDRQAYASRFVRVDGLSSTSTQRFTLIEGDRGVSRPDAHADGYRASALVTCLDPAPVYDMGHYFEIKLSSVFRESKPDRPKPREPRARNAGVVLGFKATAPGEEDQLCKDASSMADSWCISSSGFYFCQRGKPTPPQMRPASQDRFNSELVRPWHRKNLPTERRTCQWPAAPKDASSLRQTLDAPITLSEGDTVGLLCMPFGALVLTVNGHREVMIADAGVPSDRHLYPIVEVANNVKSARLLPLATPPSSLE